MRHLNYLSVAILSLAISGCSTLSHLKAGTPDIIIKEATSQGITDMPNTWQVALARAGNVQIGWINALGDPILSNLVKKAQVNNRNLQIAAANVERSRALVRQAGIGLKPNVGLSTSTKRQVFIDGPAPDTASFNWGVKASWEVDIWGRIKSGEKAVIASAQSAEADYRASQHSIAAAVASAYFIGMEAWLQAGVARKTLKTLSKTNKIVNVQYKEGIATAQDVALSASDLAATRASLVAAEGAYRDAKKALQVLIGRYPDGDLALSKSLPVIPSMPASGIPSELLERRADIVAAERKVAASFYSLDQAKVANMPRFSLSGNTGGASSQLLNMLNPNNVLLNVAGSISYFLFDGGLTKYKIEQAKAEQKQALASYEQTLLTAFQEVETSLDQIGVLRDRAAALREAAEQANKALHIVRLRYNEGETDLIDVLTIQQRVFTAESNLVSAQRARLDEWIDLNLALGGSWE
ncbi:MAG: efflux transporter outer membrane subunit [Robiginitomaculum sp.]